MDSLTHLAVGVVLGHVTRGSLPRKKAMILGAAAQSLPDIDFVAALWLHPADNLLAHRGFTHSVFFAIIASCLLASMLQRWHRQPEAGLKFWFIFFMLQLLTHLSIDLMNVYGVGLLEPFDHARFSLNLLFVADPLFSICPAAACIALLVIKERDAIRRWAFAGLAGPILYLLFAFIIKLSILSTCREQFQKENVYPSRYMVTPTPLNVLLWTVIAEKDQNFMIGYRSIFDDSAIKFSTFSRNDQLLSPVHEYRDLKRLKRFSQGYYVITKEDDKILFNDIRFGQLFGWIEPHAPFAFRYYLQQPDTNTLVVQRGRFVKINKANISGTFRRIAGD